MVMYATPAELASWLQQDLDTATATQALTVVSAAFSYEADTWFAPTTTTWKVVVYGGTEIRLPFKDVVSVTEVRVGGAAITGWTLVGGVLYRTAGFGTVGAYPPTEAEVDLTHGKAAVPDDVKKSVLESAGLIYANPVGVWSETIDDYAAVFPGSRAGTPDGALTGTAMALARSYRGIAVA